MNEVVVKESLEAQLTEYLKSCSDDTKVYIGCDSEKYKNPNNDGKNYAVYTLVAVVHKDGRNGCRVFGEIHKEIDYDHKDKNPRMRLSNEFYKMADFYRKLAPLVGEREIEIHLDLNPDEDYTSSMVVKEAIGFIRGTCDGITPKLKPDAWAASKAADRFRYKCIPEYNPASILEKVD